MIDSTKFAHASTYDVYVNRETMALFKRKSRNRKGDITEDELVPLKLYVSFNGYIKFNDYRTNGKICISYIYADAFPEQVGRFQDHLDDFISFCELDHINGHTTIESNFPSNLEWSTPRLNRARTSRRIDLSTVDEKRRKRLLQHRDHMRKKRTDKEYVAQERIKDAERKLKKYYETKPLRQQQANEINAQMELLCKKSGSDNPKTN